MHRLVRGQHRPVGSGVRTCPPCARTVDHDRVRVAQRVVPRRHELEDNRKRTGFFEPFRVGTQALVARRYAEGNRHAAGAVLANAVRQAIGPKV